MAHQQHRVVDLVDADVLQPLVDVVRVVQDDLEVGLRSRRAALRSHLHAWLVQAEVGGLDPMAGGLQRQGDDVGLVQLAEEHVVVVMHRPGQPNLGGSVAQGDQTRAALREHTVGVG